MSIELLQFNMSWADRIVMASSQLSQRQAAEVRLELELLDGILKWQAANPYGDDSVDPFDYLRSKLDKMKEETAEFESFVRRIFSEEGHRTATGTLMRARQSIHQNMMDRSRSKSPSRAGSVSVSVLSAPGSPSV